MKSELLDIRQALLQHAAIDIAQRRDFSILQGCIPVNVADAASAQSADRHAYPIVGAQNPLLVPRS